MFHNRSKYVHSLRQPINFIEKLELRGVRYSDYTIQGYTETRTLVKILFKTLVTYILSQT